MKNFTSLYLGILLIFSFNSYAQKVSTTLADSKYDKYAYIKAVNTYQRIAEKGYKSEDMFQKLGNSYYFNGDLEQSARWYEELFTMNPNQDSEYLYRYAQSLKAIGQMDKAKKMLDLFARKSSNDSRAKILEKNKNYLEQIKANSGRYKIEDAGVNSKYSDYGSALNGDKLVFCSARDTGSLSKRTHSWTEQNFTNLYYADLGEEMTPGTINKFSKKINTKFNEATPVFTKDGKTMYFTRNNYYKGKRGKDQNNITLLKLYRASLEDGNWEKVTELPFNSDQYSVAHPTLSPDEKTLYFASDMPGTLGQSDLFKVSINEDGSFGTPENLGNGINTEGRETFPMITDENELYFASDGHPGLGGLDVFVALIQNNASIDLIQNLGEGVNSPKDDFAYLIDTKSRRGFFTSNRDSGQGYDDIYKFLETRKLELVCTQSLAGVVIDSGTQQPLAQAKLSLYDSNFVLISTTISDESGKYNFAVECGKTYQIRAEKPDYSTSEQRVVIPNESGKTEKNIQLESTKEKIVIGDDLAKKFKIKMIYFDLGKYDIKPKAELELSKILQAMLDNPTMKIDVRSHTDCRQSAKNNMILSDNRVKSTIAWLIKKGISSDRLTGRGYGESQLVNGCACEPTSKSSCTEEEHQLNRRSEFIIMSL